jgi:hypothetical protein
MMTGWPMWAQVWAALSVFTFGLLLGLSPKDDINPASNVLLSMLLAVLWPIPMVVGLLEVGRQMIWRRRDR